MLLSGMNQLGTAVKESLRTLTVDNHTEVKEKVPSIQKTYVDSVELSDRAIELSMGADTGTAFKEKSDTDQGQDEDPGTIQRLVPVLTKAVPLNVFA
jgi:hypothetical protein